MSVCSMKSDIFPMLPICPDFVELMQNRVFRAKNSVNTSVVNFKQMLRLMQIGLKNNTGLSRNADNLELRTITSGALNGFGFSVEGVFL